MNLFEPPSPLVVVAEATPMLLLAKLLGAVAGSVISIVYILPKGRREAALRLSVGLVTGLIFGGTVGVKAADMLGLLGKVSAFEITLTGAALASLGGWWGVGVFKRVLDQLPSSKWLSSAKPVSKKEEKAND